MSNEYKDWIEDLKNAPVGSEDHKTWLLIQSFRSETENTNEKKN